jgi:hypothetical protein
MMLSQEHRRALELLASSPHAVTEAVLMVYGFPAETLAKLVLAELATIVTETIKWAASGWKIRVDRVRITEAGLRTLIVIRRAKFASRLTASAISFPP